MLSAKKLYKEVNGKYILWSVDISIEQGRITSLIGPSGSGKTSLLNALSFVDIPKSGTIILDNEVYDFPESRPAPSPKVAVVFQQLFLYPHLTLRENINVSGRMCPGEVNILIAAFNMDEFVDRYPNQVSVGEKQRAALARAIALKPKYLLLDEATSALDMEQIEDVVTYLKKLKLQGVGILVVTHSSQLVKKISDYIIFMDRGQVVESGKDVLIKPKENRTKEFLKFFQ